MKDGIRSRLIKKVADAKSDDPETKVQKVVVQGIPAKTFVGIILGLVVVIGLGVYLLRGLLRWALH